ncbi:uncharacterized protein VDAG_00417 [Verticillium dahliae VdLs.17]|uniref:Uncharacterized protein n=1 Tax=Verticillium dahliae (strain VdLs.17 / ATCC MYA-4575 / FGSC 10137) TaxID=498257 RepID=G2WS84_VERDV|nr:uncharacterized protein VDAG_00417 [Verticillium dahliae VdLs.17]EGY13735.1 hypothetical protein VDAG_00417 [Verticillium dahliae VdLs.17]
MYLPPRNDGRKDSGSSWRREWTGKCRRECSVQVQAVAPAWKGCLSLSSDTVPALSRAQQAQVEGPARGPSSRAQLEANAPCGQFSYTPGLASRRVPHRSRCQAGTPHKPQSRRTGEKLARCRRYIQFGPSPPDVTAAGASQKLDEPQP